MNGQSLLTYNSNLLSRTHPARLAETTAKALKLIADGTVRVDITAEYELADIASAVMDLSAGGHRGKSIVRID